MELLNRALNVSFDLLLWPVQTLPWWVQVCWLGLPAAAFALLVFRFTSNQAGLARAKDRVKAHLYELLLFRDDLGVTLRAQRDVLVANLGYLRHTLIPLAVMIGPFVLILVQVESRFALRAYEPGENVLVRVKLADGVLASAIDSDLRIAAPPNADGDFEPAGVRAETQALRIDRERELVWRLRALREGEYALEVDVGDEALELPIRVGASSEPVVPALAPSDLGLLLEPRAVPFAGERVRSLELDYPRAHTLTLGLSTAGWLFFGASLVAGFALRRPFGVEL